MCLDAFCRCAQIFGWRMAGNRKRPDWSLCPQLEPFADITNKPRTAQDAVERPPATRRRLNHTPVVEASARARLLLPQALQFIYEVDKYATEYRVAPLLDMMMVFKATFGAVDGQHAVQSAGESDQDAGREAHARPAVH